MSDCCLALVLTSSIFSFFTDFPLMDNFTVPGELEGDKKTEDVDDDGDLTEGVETFVEATVGLTAAGENGGVMGSFGVDIFFEGVCATISDAEVVVDDDDIILRVTEGGIFILSADFWVIGNCEFRTLGESSLFTGEICLTILSEASWLKCFEM